MENTLFMIRQGDVWVSDMEGNHARALTQTGGKVNRFLVSPDLRFIAFTQEVKAIPEPGTWRKPSVIPDLPPAEGSSPQRSIYTIRVLELKTFQLHYEIEPPTDNWFYMKTWLPGNQLLVAGASGFDVWGHFVADPERKKINKIFDFQGYRFVYGFRLDLDIHPTGTLYISESGSGDTFRENLHWRTSASLTDVVLFSRPSLFSPSLSPDGRSVAVMESEYHSGQMRDKIWLIDLEKNTSSLLYSGEMKAKGKNGLSWSGDGRRLCMDLLPAAVVVNAAGLGEPIELPGDQPCWQDEKHILFSHPKGIYCLSLDDKSLSPIVPGATAPWVETKYVKP